MFKLEMRNTERWEDVRYRAYTSSRKKADEFMAKVTKIGFTDSGHGLVPTVSECKSRTEPAIYIQDAHVRACLSGGK
jgi:hypothetical protein